MVFSPFGTFFESRISGLVVALDSEAFTEAWASAPAKVALEVLGFAAACDAARRHGHTPVIRPAGGHAAVYDQRCVVVEHVSAEEDVTAGLQDRFAAQS